MCYIYDPTTLGACIYFVLTPVSQLTRYTVTLYTRTQYTPVSMFPCQ